MPISQIEQVAVGKLRPHPTNVHIHSKKQIAQIANSIGQFGFIDPIICNESGNRVARRRSMSAFGGKTDMCSAKGHVRSTPESGHLQCN
jgi:ParB/Sulfiredoxin domain